MMTVRRPKKQLLTILAGGLAVVSFLILSSVAIVWANGLKFNPKTLNFDQTVLIAIEGALDNVTITLNGEVVGSQTPLRLRSLLPGRYNLIISRKGFQSWQQSFDLREGQVGLIKDPFLVAEHPVVSLSDEKPLITDYSTFDRGLVASSGELSDHGQLVTRFSTEISQAHRFQSGYIYQQGGQLRLFIPAGDQDWLLYSSDTSELMRLQIIDSSWQIAVGFPDSTKIINLQLPQG